MRCSSRRAAADVAHRPRRPHDHHSAGVVAHRGRPDLPHDRRWATASWRTCATASSSHLQSMDLGFFTGTQTGDIQSRLGNDVGGVQSVVTETASSILSNVGHRDASLVAHAAAVLAADPRRPGPAARLRVLQVRVGRVRRRLAARTQTSLSDMTAITQETLSVSGILLAKVFNRQATETARYRAENERQVDAAGPPDDDRAAVLRDRPDLLRGHPGAGLPRRRARPAGGSTLLSAGTLVAFTTLQTRLLFPVSTCCGWRWTCRPRWRCSPGSSRTST